MPYRLPECSILSESFALYERRPTIPSPECSTPMGEGIYFHQQTDSFVLSELFSVARHAGRSKPGSNCFSPLISFPFRQLFRPCIYLYNELRGWPFNPDIFKGTQTHQLVVYLHQLISALNMNKIIQWCVCACVCCEFHCVVWICMCEKSSFVLVSLDLFEYQSSCVI